MRKAELLEREVVCLILSYLERRGLCASVISLELESGLTRHNGLSDDFLFLRRLVMSGRWDDVGSFLQPLQLHPKLEVRTQERRARFLVEKQRLLELLAGAPSIDCAASEYEDFEEHSEAALRRCTSSLEELCEDQAEFSRLCLLLTLRDFRQHPTYRDWTVYSSRLQCFDLLRDVLTSSGHRGDEGDARKSRATHSTWDAEDVWATPSLVRLLAQGVLFSDLCRDFHLRAAGDESRPAQTHPLHLNVLLCNQPEGSVSPTSLRTQPGALESFRVDTDLHSWLWSLPKKAFSTQRAESAVGGMEVHVSHLSPPPNSPKLPTRPQSCMEHSRSSSPDPVESNLLRSWHGMSASFEFENGRHDQHLIASDTVAERRQLINLSESVSADQSKPSVPFAEQPEAYDDEQAVERAVTPQEQRSLWHQPLKTTHENYLERSKESTAREGTPAMADNDGTMMPHDAIDDVITRSFQHLEVEDFRSVQPVEQDRSIDDVALEIAQPNLTQQMHTPSLSPHQSQTHSPSPSLGQPQMYAPSSTPCEPPTSRDFPLRCTMPPFHVHHGDGNVASADDIARLRTSTPKPLQDLHTFVTSVHSPDSSPVHTCFRTSDAESDFMLLPSIHSARTAGNGIGHESSNVPGKLVVG